MEGGKKHVRIGLENRLGMYYVLYKPNIACSGTARSLVCFAPLLRDCPARFNQVHKCCQSMGIPILLNTDIFFIQSAIVPSLFKFRGNERPIPIQPWQIR
jgi:hypothetical protein